MNKLRSFLRSLAFPQICLEAPDRTVAGRPAWLALLVLVGLAGEPSAQEAPPPAGPATLPPVAQIEPFFDGLMAGQMKAHGIPGGVVALVAHDRLLFAKGYGFADAQARTPVQAESTLFCIGSVSKLFVWTAVMQLVAEGKLDLDADVNRYLKGLQVPPTFAQPITMKHLMTHTAGFEDWVIGGTVTDPARLRSLAQVLKEQMPARVRPPGEIASYSNHGTGLAACIVEQVSGLGWDDYVEQRILKPLGMTRTSFRQPLPDALRPDSAKPHRLDGTVFPLEYLELAPVGGAFTAAHDIVKFMRMHLNLGRLEGAQVLEEAAARRMQSALFQPGPEVNAAAYGFYEMNFNGHRVIGHGGDVFGFHALLALLPESRLGLFLAFDGDGGGTARDEIYEAFMNRFFPGAAAPRWAPEAEAKAALQRFAGQYRSVRYSHTTYAKLAVLVLDAPTTVQVTDDGKLKTSAPGAAVRTWMPTGKLAFREEHGHRRIAFREDEQGNVAHLLIEFPGVALERIGWRDAPGLHANLALLWILIVVAAFWGWPAAAWIRWRSRAQLEPQKLVPGWARLSGWLTGLLVLMFLAVFVWVMRDPFQVRFGTPRVLSVGLWLVRLQAVLTVVLVVMLGRLWRRRQVQLSGRLGFTLVVVGCGLSLWQLHHWRVLTWPF